MKPILSFFLFIFSCTFCFGQDWKPYVLNAKCIYGYTRNDTTTSLLRISYDSMYVSGGTEIAFAYTRSYSNDTCLNEAHKEIRFDAYREYPHDWVYPFPIEIKLNGDSIISSSFVLLKNAHKGRQWDDYGYENDSVMDILGVPDSVRIYSSEYFHRIVLSKHFGLVQLGGHILKGFKTDSLTLGLSIPLIETTFSLAPGDILYHRTVTDTLPSHLNGEYRLHIDTRDSITDVIITSDTLSLSLMRTTQNYFEPALSSGPTPITFKTYLPELNSLFQDGPPVLRYENGFYVRRPILMLMGADTVYTVNLNQNGHFGNCRFGFMYDICSAVSFASNTLFYANSSCNAIYGGGTQTDLIGSRIGNKITGHINLSLETPKSAFEDVTVFPNPTADLLNLSTNNKMDFTILDVLGNKQLEGKTSQTISLQALPSGLYMLILRTNNNSKSFRILKK